MSLLNVFVTNYFKKRIYELMYFNIFDFNKFSVYEKAFESGSEEQRKAIIELDPK